MCILRCKQILHQHISEALNLNLEMLLSVLELGYSNDYLATHWIKHFYYYTEKLQQGTFQILIFDGYESHLIYNFISFCYNYNIIPFNLPSYLSYIM
ncbi:hypothetical protein P154DRAFT_446701 [Amniculicola lignicola CBS 123094]|uniref:DDE-1 domain-containing protein n=1 Tax=Amniculicola lignicola CBS 123094 TaxID=1392246 RepID=A0A6A5W1K7_9PLEO|nr:hypothetical protein P154DRAFT_446701 [Amniculicola lignicola CBS 123094]